jgi:predicted anti-sigma-YlaC factor YlaD
MDCKTVKQNIIFIADGSLSEKELAQAKTHFDSCGACSQLYNNVSSSLALHAAQYTMPDSDTFYGSIIEKIESRQAVSVRKQKIQIAYKFLQPLLAAASITIAIFLGVHLLNNLKESEASKSVVDVRASTINELASQYQMKDNGTDEVDTYYLNK